MNKLFRLIVIVILIVDMFNIQAIRTKLAPDADHSEIVAMDIIRSVETKIKNL